MKREPTGEQHAIVALADMHAKAESGRKAAQEMRDRAVKVLEWYRAMICQNRIDSTWSTEMEALADAVDAFDNERMPNGKQEA